MTSNADSKNDESLLTRPQLAARANVHISTVDRWRGDGVGPSWILLGTRSIRYRAEEVDRWLRENQTTCGAEGTVA